MRGVDWAKTDPAMVWLVYALPLSGIAGGTYMLVRGRPVPYGPRLTFGCSASREP